MSALQDLPAAARHASGARDVGTWREKRDDMLYDARRDDTQSHDTQSHDTQTGADPAVNLLDLAAADQAAGATGPAQELTELALLALSALADGAADRAGALPGGGAEAVTADVRSALGGKVLPGEGIGDYAALTALTRAFARGAADPAQAWCAGHLHTPPLPVATAADLAISALNQSLDSWDQAPAAVAFETEVIAALAGLVGYEPTRASGVLTTGGTESNLMGLLLARDAAVRKHAGNPAPEDGLPAALAGRLRILCSEEAHFSIARNAAVLGLGERCVVPLPTVDHRMDFTALGEALERITRAGDVPAAVIATAGSTDFGGIDPLPQVAELARMYGAWFHVDAAYGGGALLSERLAPLLRGVEQADSVALDLHKFGWQPVPAGIFLVRRAASLAPLEREVAYLNPADDRAAGYPSLLGRSLRTTRRADAFKIAVTMRALGRSGLGARVDRCHELAVHAARAIEARPELKLQAEPVLASVVFAYRAAQDSDRVNAALRRRLLAEGRAVIGRTDLTWPAPGTGRVRLKLTLLNPATTRADIEALLDAVVEAGRKEEGC